MESILQLAKHHHFQKQKQIFFREIEIRKKFHEIEIQKFREIEIPAAMCLFFPFLRSTIIFCFHDIFQSIA
jgi:hypothetical protein